MFYFRSRLPFWDALYMDVCLSCLVQAWLYTCLYICRVRRVPIHMLANMSMNKLIGYVFLDPCVSVCTDMSIAVGFVLVCSIWLATLSAPVLTSRILSGT